MGRLLLLFTIVPLLEVYLLYVLGTVMGFWPTVGVVLGTGLLGAALAKREGLKVWRSWQKALAEGQLPDEGILGGVLVLIGGVLLVTPGVLTDATGLSLMIPPVRRLVADVVRKRLERRVAEGTATFGYRVDLGNGRVVEEVRMRGRPPHDPNVIDAESEVVEEIRSDSPMGQLDG